MATKIPAWLTGRLAALAILTGTAGTVYVTGDFHTQAGLQDEYVKAVAADTEVSQEVKIAMVMGWFYESSGKHIGTPYVDKLGKGQPLTVCNGITGPEVVAGKWYSMAECYHLEKRRYLQSEVEARRLLAYWSTYTPLTRATFIDFVHNKGAANLATSTARTLANRGDIAGACKQMPRWNMGTVNGIKTVLPGLQLRGDANGELCADWSTT